MRGSERGWGHPLKNHKNKGFLSNTGPDPLKNHKAERPAFSVGQLSAYQGNESLKWRFASGPMIALLVVFGSSLPSAIKKHCKGRIPSDKTFWIRIYKLESCLFKFPSKFG